MLAWLRDLTSRERRTMLACWGGWTLDGFDQQLYSYVAPTVIAVWGMSTGAAGTIGTITVRPRSRWAEQSPGGLLMPNQSLLYTGRVLASSQLNPMMRVCRELCGGQICVTPDFAAFQDPETAPWLEKYYTINEDWRSEDRRRRLAFARPAQLQLRRSPADLPALRAIAAFCPPHHGLPEISTGTHRSASSTSPLAFRTGCSSASERCGRAQPARGIRVSG
jgi:hypothetical protein